MSKRRYFEDSKSKPGIISEELRRALSMHSSRLPIWIYRMRVLGYPPGWLKDAQINTLALFDGKLIDNNNTKPINPVIGCEDGEIVGKHYNKESFIEYPGFNVALPQGVSDDWYELRMPPMLPQQQLEEALKTMKVTEPVPYKRMKREPMVTSTPASNSSSTSKSTHSPSHNNNNDSTNTSLDSSKSFKDESHISSNDSLNENKITDQLCEIPSSQLNVNSNESINCENNVWDDLEKANEMSQNVSVETPSKSDTSLDISSESVRKLKLVSMGSPMPISSNPKRPSLDKWSEGMGDLIYFENLPTSTGVYMNKMKGVIDKIRQKNSQT